MQVIDMRKSLVTLLRECCVCSAEFRENVALILDDRGNLTDDQVSWVLNHMVKLHFTHCHVH